MSERILVSGPEAPWAKWVTRGAGAVLILLAAYLALEGLWRVGGLLIAAVAIAVLVGGELWTASRLAARRWVVDTGSGLRWMGEQTEIMVEDRQIIAMRVAYRRKYSAGILKHVHRQFEVWTEDRAAPLRMRNRIAVGMRDPLDTVIHRMCRDLKARAAAGLANGQPLSGDDWSLRPAELTIRQGRAFRSVPFAEIDKVGLFDGRFCVWCRGVDEPVARIDPASRNAPVLDALLSEWVSHQRDNPPSHARAAAPEDATTAPPDGSGLGKLLFERRKRKLGVYLWIGAFIVFWLGLATSLGGGDEIIGGAIIAASLGVVYVAWGWFAFVFRCHERGLYRKWGRRESRVLYADIIEFTYSAMRIHHGGDYLGTRFALKFVAPQGRITYSAMVNKPDEELDKLRDHLANLIAGRMLRDLQEGRTVAWTKGIYLLPDGLQFQRSKAIGLGSQPPEVLPYDQIRAVNLKDGTFYLWNQIDSKPIVSVPDSASNFFPGFFVILMKLPSASTEAPG